MPAKKRKPTKTVKRKRRARSPVPPIPHMRRQKTPPSAQSPAGYNPLLDVDDDPVPE